MLKARQKNQQDHRDKKSCRIRTLKARKKNKQDHRDAPEEEYLQSCQIRIAAGKKVASVHRNAIVNKMRKC